MSRPKKNKKEDKEKAEILFEYWIDYTYTCPIRGQVTERVKATRYQAQKYKPGALDVESLDLIKETEYIED